MKVRRYIKWVRACDYEKEHNNTLSDVSLDRPDSMRWLAVTISSFSVN